MKSTRAGWIEKFRVAVSGLVISVRTQPSFWVHLTAAASVVGVAAALQIESWRWCVLLIVISVVLAAELLNTAIEQLVSVLHPEHHPRVGEALDAAAAAVLIASAGAVVVGLVALLPPLWQWLTG